MFEKITSLINVFRKGRMVANPELWKKGQITLGAVTAFLAAIIATVKVFGVEVPITEDQISTIAEFILIVNGVFHPVATVVSSEKVGVSPKPDTPAPNPLTGR